MNREEMIIKALEFYANRCGAGKDAELAVKLWPHDGYGGTARKALAEHAAALAHEDGGGDRRPAETWVREAYFEGYCDGGNEDAAKANMRWLKSASKERISHVPSEPACGEGEGEGLYRDRDHFADFVEALIELAPEELLNEANERVGVSTKDIADHARELMRRAAAEAQPPASLSETDLQVFQEGEQFLAESAEFRRGLREKYGKAEPSEGPCLGCEDACHSGDPDTCCHGTEVGEPCPHCPVCSPKPECETCGGFGEVEARSPVNGERFMDVCPSCTPDEKPKCETCGGTDYIYHEGCDVPGCDHEEPCPSCTTDEPREDQ